MKNNEAVSMISLIITVLIIIILASVSSFYLSSTIDDTQYKDALEELKNVENVVEYAKTQILIDKFEPDETLLITDSQLENKFGTILSEKEIEEIKLVNNSSKIEAPYKYYLMNQERFDKEFGNDYNVSNLRPAREYLVNYMDTVVVSTYKSQRLASTEDITVTDEIERAEITVKFIPNGNTEWKKQQATIVSIDSNASATIKSSKYLWSQSYSEPANSAFINAISDNQEVELLAETGNDWYLWIFVCYEENGVEKTYKVRSEPFYVDNTAPTGELKTESIKK